MIFRTLSLVTIYIPTFNRLELLKRSVNSVLNQTYSNIELIVVDDCSTDGTQDYLKEISSQDSRVKYFLKEKNSGACVSRNIAIRNAQGYFITGLDDDDFFDLDRIESLVNAWRKKNEGTIALSTLYKIKNKNKTIYGKKLFKNKFIKFDDLFLNNAVGNQIFTKTEVLKKIDGFDENLKCWQDLECWLRVLNIGNIEKIFLHSYTIDVSHDKPRIGNSNHTKYLKSYDYISKKHDLRGWKKEYLYIQTFNCNGVDVDKGTILKVLKKYPSFELFIMVLKAYVKGVK
ncbi:glycosyltransferase family 2 protein [Acinetobacter sp. YH16032]|uniref:glycosyltransferase family 2 protein n=1 Tax=Acinetobacter sp. YH16032 TaxID=2601181 RepID=UPI0015D23DE6